MVVYPSTNRYGMNLINTDDIYYLKNNYYAKSAGLWVYNTETEELNMFWFLIDEFNYWINIPYLSGTNTAIRCVKDKN